MFVRWKKRKLMRGDHSLTAVLVESQRVNGKPRLKIIQTLATIKERDMNSYRLSAWKTAHRKLFWSWIEYKLDSLNLPPEQRAKIASEVARRVPQWTAQDQVRLDAHIRETDEQCRRWEARYRAKFGIPDPHDNEQRV